MRVRESTTMSMTHTFALAFIVSFAASCGGEVSGARDTDPPQCVTDCDCMDGEQSECMPSSCVDGSCVRATRDGDLCGHGGTCAAEWCCAGVSCTIVVIVSGSCGN